MRLFHSTDFAFKEFLGSNIPDYAIVSHRWSEEEISHQDYLDGKRHGYGWTKIWKACEIARSNSFDWIWIDTICIDKKSSAELSEAINSMYKWYAGSKICYVFLPDVLCIPQCGCEPPHELKAPIDGRRPRLCGAQFKRSTWFTRGWTLQELLAPNRVDFFDASFQHGGSKSNLDREISECTGIENIYLRYSHWVSSMASVAKRMYWASQRQTTREEDMAYSLLGLFDVNMPLLYGEGGSKAFVRLQIEIIRKSTDESIFAWPLALAKYQNWDGLLANSPDAFSGASNIGNDNCGSRHHYEMTNKGLRFSVYLSERLRQFVDEARRSPGLAYPSAMKLVLPLNCYKLCPGLRPPESSCGLAISITAYANNRSRFLMAHRDDGGFRKALHNGLLKSVKNHIDDNLNVSFTYENHGITYSLDEPIANGSIFVLGSSAEDGEEWDIYFEQHGM